MYSCVRFAIPRGCAEHGFLCHVGRRRPSMQVSASARKHRFLSPARRFTGRLGPWGRPDGDRPSRRDLRANQPRIREGNTGTDSGLRCASTGVGTPRFFRSQGRIGPCAHAELAIRPAPAAAPVRRQGPADSHASASPSAAAVSAPGSGGSGASVTSALLIRKSRIFSSRI